VYNAIDATPRMLNVNAGRIKCLSQSQNDTSWLNAPIGTPPLTGNSPR